ncbi:retrovirus-related pol polyprotein from transposon TNT 1-94 [Tanacetum coccineum]
MSINHEKYTLVIVDEYSRYTWVHFLRKKSQAPEMIMSFIKIQNDVKVKQIKTNNGTEFRNSKLESFCDEKGISQNFSSPYTPKQNGVAERKNRTLIEAARTDQSLSKDMIRPLMRYSEKESLISAAFMCLDVAIRFTNTSIDEIGINDSSRYPLDEFLHEDDPSRQYQADSDISYYVIPHGRSLTELTQEKHVPEMNAPNEQDTPHTENVESPFDLTNTKETQEQNVQVEQIINQPTKESLGNNTKTSIPTTKPLVIEVIHDPREGMLTRSMVAKLTAASASECLFADFLSEIEPKKEEGIDYDETFAPVCLPEWKTKRRSLCEIAPGFESSEFPNYVSKLDKALYGLKQALRACTMGELTYFLELQIKQDDKGISIYQEQFTRNLQKKYEISDSSSVKTPMVPPNNSGPDLAGKPSSPKESHLIAVKRIFKYLKGTPSFAPRVPAKYLGGKLVCWSAKKQQSVDMSSAEAEYVDVAGCCANILWMTSQLSDYDIHYKMVPIFCDNTSAIAISTNPLLHSRTKHIDIRYHFIRDYILKGDIKLHFIPT